MHPQQKSPFRRVVHSFDHLEDRVRHTLVHYRIPYAIIATIGTVMLWRGVWELSSAAPILAHPLVTAIIGFIILGVTGVYTTLIGTELISATLRQEGHTMHEIEREVIREAQDEHRFEKEFETFATHEQEEDAHIAKELRALQRRTEAILRILNERKNRRV